VTINRRSHVTVYDDEKRTIKRKLAYHIEEGETILLIDDQAGDIYDVLVQSAHERERVRECEQLINGWRNRLIRKMNEKDYDYGDIRSFIRHDESNIETKVAIRNWAEGSTIGPQDPEDVRRVLKISCPELNGHNLHDVYQEVVKAIRHIRLLHWEIGRNIRRVIEREMNPSRDPKLGKNVNLSMIRSITRDIERGTITSISEGS